MRVAQRLLMATPASIGSKSSLSEALALLPPLQLYRRILRVHRKLEPEMRVLGDSYVKNEFRAHRTVENPLHIVSLFRSVLRWSYSVEEMTADQGGSARAPISRLELLLTFIFTDRILD
jgi:hypothetical protein